jgi:hypothetical protein
VVSVLAMDIGMLGAQQRLHVLMVHPQIRFLHWPWHPLDAVRCRHRLIRLRGFSPIAMVVEDLGLVLQVPAGEFGFVYAGVADRIRGAEFACHSECDRRRGLVVGN